MTKGYKAFNKDMTCNNFQYEEGGEYTTKEAILCQNGFNFCVNPLDVLSCYDLCSSEFHNVESTGEEDKAEGDTKISTTKIKIGAKLNLKRFIDASINFLLDIYIEKSKDNSGYSAQLASSGDYAQLASSGDSAKLASSGYSAQLASSGYSAQLASSGDYAQLASSGYSAQLASSGYSAQLASSGDSAQLASSGDSAKLASSGDSAQLNIKGKNSVGAAIGPRSKIKGKKGAWITLSEYDNNGNVVCVKSAKITNRKLKEDTWYKLENKKFVEC